MTWGPCHREVRAGTSRADKWPSSGREKIVLLGEESRPMSGRETGTHQSLKIRIRQTNDIDHYQEIKNCCPG